MADKSRHDSAQLLQVAYHLISEIGPGALSMEADRVDQWWDIRDKWVERYLAYCKSRQRVVSSGGSTNEGTER